LESRTGAGMEDIAYRIKGESSGRILLLSIRWARV